MAQNDFGESLVMEELVVDETDPKYRPDLIDEIVHWSNDLSTMVPITPESIKRHHIPRVIHASNGDWVGYGAMTVVYSASTIEFGGVLVHPDYRLRGIASRIVKEVVKSSREEMQPELILAFSNKVSARLFEALGGVVVPNSDELPQEVWKLCLSCRQYQEAQDMGEICCGRIFDITDIDCD